MGTGLIQDKGYLTVTKLHQEFQMTVLQLAPEMEKFVKERLETVLETLVGHRTDRFHRLTQEQGLRSMECALTDELNRAFPTKKPSEVRLTWKMDPCCWGGYGVNANIILGDENEVVTRTLGIEEYVEQRIAAAKKEWMEEARSTFEQQLREVMPKIEQQLREIEPVAKGDPVTALRDQVVRFKLVSGG